MDERYELVIFDCDGVLVDSEHLTLQVNQEILGKYGWPLGKQEMVRRFVGRSYAVVKADIERHLGDRLPPGWEAELQQLQDEAFRTRLTPVDGVIEALERISVPTCVASSGDHDKLRRTLGLTGLYERFAGRIFSATEVAEGKPAPDLFLHAAARMGADPRACAVVEDSRYGVEAARRAGMDCFAYTGGITPAAWLDGPGTVLFDDMRALPDLLQPTA